MNILLTKIVLSHCTSTTFWSFTPTTILSLALVTLTRHSSTNDFQYSYEIARQRLSLMTAIFNLERE